MRLSTAVRANAEALILALQQDLAKNVNGVQQRSDKIVFVLTQTIQYLQRQLEAIQGEFAEAAILEKQASDAEANLLSSDLKAVGIQRVGPGNVQFTHKARVALDALMEEERKLRDSLFPAESDQKPVVSFTDATALVDTFLRLGTSLRTAKDNYDVVARDVKELEKTKSLLENFKALSASKSTEINTLRKEVNALKADVEGLNERIMTLSNDNDKIAQNRNEVYAKYNALATDNSSLRKLYEEAGQALVIQQNASITTTERHASQIKSFQDHIALLEDSQREALDEVTIFTDKNRLLHDMNRKLRRKIREMLGERSQKARELEELLREYSDSDLDPPATPPSPPAEHRSIMRPVRSGGGQSASQNANRPASAIVTGSPSIMHAVPPENQQTPRPQSLLDRLNTRTPPPHFARTDGRVASQTSPSNSPILTSKTPMGMEALGGQRPVTPHNAANRMVRIPSQPSHPPSAPLLNPPTRSPQNANRTIPNVSLPMQPKPLITAPTGIKRPPSSGGTTDPRLAKVPRTAPQFEQSSPPGPPSRPRSSHYPSRANSDWY